MREVGIPARVVVGYQGGEYNPYEDYTLVYQYNAHAWAEAWFEGEGWVRFDPTAAVAPERITLGVESIFADQPGFLEDAGFSMMRFRDTQWLNTLRLRLDAMDYAWNRWVVSYDEDMQNQLLGSWFGENARQGLLLTLGSVIVLFFILGGWLLLRKGQYRQHDPASRIYLALLRELAVCGLPRKRGEGPGAYCRRVAALRPEYAEQLQQVTTQFEALAYLQTSAAAAADSSRLGQLRALEEGSWQLRRRLLSPWRRLLVTLGVVR